VQPHGDTVRRTPRDVAAVLAPAGRRPRPASPPSLLAVLSLSTGGSGPQEPRPKFSLLSRLGSRAVTPGEKRESVLRRSAERVGRQEAVWRQGPAVRCALATRAARSFGSGGLTRRTASAGGGGLAIDHSKLREQSYSCKCLSSGGRGADEHSTVTTGECFWSSPSTLFVTSRRLGKSLRSLPPCRQPGVNMCPIGRGDQLDGASPSHLELQGFTLGRQPEGHKCWTWLAIFLSLLATGTQGRQRPCPLVQAA
jgi:hypothetical protein